MVCPPEERVERRAEEEEAEAEAEEEEEEEEEEGREWQRGAGVALGPLGGREGNGGQRRDPPKVLREQSRRGSNSLSGCFRKCVRRRGKNVMFDTSVRGAEARVQNDC